MYLQQMKCPGCGATVSDSARCCYCQSKFVNTEKQTTHDTQAYSCIPKYRNMWSGGRGWS